MFPVFLIASIMVAAPSIATAADGDQPATESWQQRLAAELPLLGHRNWIVVADSAYPQQTRPGVETYYIGGDQLEAVEAVLQAVDEAKHVQAVPLLDAELPAVAETDAPGIDAYRAGLDELMKGRPTQTVPHEDIIGELDEAGKLFRVVILKTDMTLPYTSVFLRLECGYWTPEKEGRLREAMKTNE